MKIHYIDPAEIDAAIDGAAELELAEPFRIEPPFRLHPDRVAANARRRAVENAARMDRIVAWTSIVLLVGLVAGIYVGVR